MIIKHIANHGPTRPLLMFATIVMTDMKAESAKMACDTANLRIYLEEALPVAHMQKPQIFTHANFVHRADTNKQEGVVCRAKQDTV